MPTKKRKTLTRQTKTRKSESRQHPKHFLKVYWPYLPVIAAVVAGMLLGGVYPQTPRSFTPATLAYATEMSVGSLLSSTNTQRANNGLGALTLNSKLNASAQAKANDMVSRDYWSHNTPDGKEPWIFFDAAGYAYQKAGENLAYGFSTSDATVIGWMNSPSHRANILDTTYAEVGFGFVNGNNFVGNGQQTIVVAHYATPIASAPAPAPAPAPSPAPASTKPQSLPASASNEVEEAIEPAPAEAPPADEQKPEPIADDRFNQPVTSDNPVPEEPRPVTITRLQRLTGGDAPWSALVLSIISFAVVIAWLIKHTILVKRFLLKGEHFVAHHPLLDAVVVVVAALAVYLSQSSGVVL